MIKELTSKDIIYTFDVEKMKIGEEKNHILEYDEVYEKIKTALEIDKAGYNVYLIDDFSKDKLNNIISFAKKVYEKKAKPKDICYVLKAEEKCPKSMLLSNGKGIELKKTLEDIQNKYIECTYDFYNNTSIKEKEEIIDNLHKKKSNLISKLSKKAEEDSFQMKPTQTGFSFTPTKDGDAMTEREYEGLDASEKEGILDKVGKLKTNAQDILEELKNIQSEEVEKIKNIMAINYKVELNDLKETYHECFLQDINAIEFIDDVCQDIESNIIDNYSTNYDDDEEKMLEIISKAKINVIVDNSENQHPQVVFEEDPSVINLLGGMEYENKNGAYTSDISLIKSGSLLKANQGCLILRANDLLNNQSAYHYLKKSLMGEKINFDYNKGYLELLSLSGLKPQTIDIKPKIILIGDYGIFDALYNNDEDFKKIFSFRAEYNPIMEKNEVSKKTLIANIMRICDENKLSTITNGAIKEIAKIQSRKAENKGKLYFDGFELSKILNLANNKVINENRKCIKGSDILVCAHGKELIEKQIFENYKENKILIEVEGSSIGQINALSVIDTGFFSFGKPIRITCSCYKGEGNIIDVQKESNLSGNIHRKSINILKGYINKLIGGYSKLPVDFHIIFEQIYGMVDGDSASVAEVISMISALSKIAIKQNIALTGSINQFGEVQPIGGVNEKIEGFFKTCKLIDNCVNKGVLIPYSNKDDLVLSEEVEKEIANGNFHIYTMVTVDDAIDTMMCSENINMEGVLASLDKEINKYLKKVK